MSSRAIVSSGSLPRPARHAHTNAELVGAARAQIAELTANPAQT